MLFPVVDAAVFKTVNRIGDQQGPSGLFRTVRVMDGSLTRSTEYWTRAFYIKGLLTFLVGKSMKQPQLDPDNQGV